MKEKIVSGKSLEEIREMVSLEWACTPEALVLEVIEKPGLFNRSFKVKVVLPEAGVQSTEQEEVCENTQENGDQSDITQADEVNRTGLPDKTLVILENTTYRIQPGTSVEKIVPYPQAGKLLINGKEITSESPVQPGDAIEFLPSTGKVMMVWDIIADTDGRKAVARVWRENTGHTVLSEDIKNEPVIILANHIIDTTGSLPGNEKVAKTENDLMKDIAAKGIIHGIRPNVWNELQLVENQGEIIIAEATPPVPTVQPEIIDYVGEPLSSNEDSNEAKIDYFACKIRICEKDELLAQKIPGKEGVPGTDIFGKPIPVDKIKDFKLNLKRNVYLTPAQEVRASCSGTPIRSNTNTYSIENIYVLNKDVDLSTGSIEFPGDVFLGGNVTDNHYIHSKHGMVKIMGSVSGAEIKADTGLVVKNNIIASKIVVGEKHVCRSEFIKSLQEVHEELGLCLAQLEQLQMASGNTNAGQIFKLILEKNFQTLPKKAEDTERLLSVQEPDFVSNDLDLAIRTLKHFLVGLGPLQLKDATYLKNALRIIDYFMEQKGISTPTSVVCDVSYIQNSEVSCAGDFFCHKGVYNSILKIEGSVKIHGVCRGGEISCSGDLYIWELGASNMSATTIRAGKKSHITIELCYSNIKIFVGKELVKIDEPSQKIEIFRDRGILQVAKLRWDGNNGNNTNQGNNHHA
ncbi:FapA family protein [Dehalobacter sp. DCM]|uniref:FapA family protein n=1 Tax=Dehalobacter sp. DCM TaxID=2907827 RepID=UPI003081A7ED|nr:FapA family protein [Dehalobacter sp. DCM]